MPARDPDLRKQIALLLILTSVVTLGSLASTVRAQTCGMQYQLTSRGASYPGATVTLVNNFTNSGSDALQVTGITATTDFGTFSAPSSKLPLSVPASGGELDFDIQVPSSASVGSHSFSSSAAFQCYEGGSWVTPSISPLVVSSKFDVGQSPGTSAAIGLVILGAIAALVVAVVVLVVKLRRRKPITPLPPPAYTPPPPPPPSGNPPTQ